MWFDSGPAVELPIPAGALGGRIEAMTPDGHRLAGFIYDANNSVRPALWIASLHLSRGAPLDAPPTYECTTLPLPAGASFSSFSAISSDGSVLCGTVFVGNTFKPAVWRAADGYAPTEPQSGNASVIQIVSMSSDGKILLANSRNGNGEAFAGVWAGDRPPLNLGIYLSEAGFEPAQQSPLGPICMSPSGRAFVVVSMRGLKRIYDVIFDLPRVDTDTCQGDFDLNLRVDDTDFVVFAAAYDIGSCGDPVITTTCPSDLNSDSVVDDRDFELFLASYQEVLCP
jgi:hypothetical protein